jgi:hypothetical protein
LKTFVDSGVLLKAWRGEDLAQEALAVLADDQREFFSSQMVRLELLPKPRFEKRLREAAFYESFFAEALAAQYGLAGPDALQIAAALRHGVGEFYTTEKPTKPMFRVKELTVISLYSLTA